MPAIMKLPIIGAPGLKTSLWAVSYSSAAATLFAKNFPYNIDIVTIFPNGNRSNNRNHNSNGNDSNHNNSDRNINTNNHSNRNSNHNSKKGLQTSELTSAMDSFQVQVILG